MERVWDSRVTPNIYIKVPQPGKFCLYMYIWLMFFDTNNVPVHLHSSGSSLHLALTVEMPFSSFLGKLLRQITYHLIQNLLKNYKSLKRELFKLVFSLLATCLGCFTLIILSKLDAHLLSERLMAKSCGWSKLSRTFSLPIWKLLGSPWAVVEPLLVQRVKPIPLFFPLLTWDEPTHINLFMTLFSLGSDCALWDCQKTLSPARWDWHTVVMSSVKAMMHERLWKSVFKPQGRSGNAGWRHHV